MKATRLHLVRHGLVEARWSGKLYGDLDVELSEEGREQARRAAWLLSERSLDCVVTSDLARARYGGERLVEERELSIRIDPRLREISRGDWAGRPIEDVRREQPGAIEAWFAEPETRRPPGGESIADLRSRVLEGLRDLVGEFAGGEVAVVAHGWVIRSTLGWVLGLPSVALTRLHVPPASIATVDWQAEHTEPVGERTGAEPLEGPHRGTPNLVGIQVDRPIDGGRGWYRSPMNANS
ncbi:MAG: histidine phosphatase family protein [Planctomycetota bacterium]|jgi:broad specificity phosphatase PhoE